MQKVSIAKLRALWLDDTLTTAQIGSTIGISADAVRNRARRIGLPPKPIGGYPNARGVIRGEMAEKFKAMHNAGVPGRDIARALGVSYRAVSNAVRRLGLKPRGRGWKCKATLEQFREQQIAQRWRTIAQAENIARKNADRKARAA